MSVVDIVLATYNGEKYLAEQLDSLLAQDFTDFRIIARDDGSTDGTVAILKRYQQANPDRMSVIEDGERLGVIQNFAALMEKSSAPYVMLCDQDDVWMKSKVRRSIEALRRLEAGTGTDSPCLVHTDAAVVDAKLGPIKPSFARWQGFVPQEQSFACELVQNVVLGCTIAMNRALVAIALPIPKEARMHDMWLALLAGACGQILYLSWPTLLYRQHGKNVVSARRPTLFGLKERARQRMRENTEQALALALRLYDIGADAASNEALRHFILLSSMRYPARVATLLRYGILRRPWYQNLPMLLWA